MKVITWNVAGFRRAKSLETWDYSEVDMDYFAKEVKKLDPDVVCLQEVLIGDGDQVEEFAKKIGYAFYVSVKMSPDHTGTDMWLGLGIISKTAIENVKSLKLPYPSFPLVFADGREAQKFDKLVLAGEVLGKTIATTQLQPLHYWGFNYYEEPGYSYAGEVGSALIGILESKPIVTGDFQVSHLEIPLRNLYQKLDLEDALPDVFTRKRQNGNHTKSDHVLLPKNSRVLAAKIIETMTDHYLCYVETND